MNRTMITASNTMNQLQKQLDTIGNNISNADTTGFKRSQTSFNDLLVQQVDNMGAESKETGRLTPLGIRSGVGARLGQVRQVMDQGTVKTTNRELDLALTAPNLYFTVQTTKNNSQSTAYTRDGSFYLTPAAGNGSQMLVTSEGDPVLDENGKTIVVTGSVSKVTFSETGTMTAVKDDGSSESFNLGVVSIKKPMFMEKAGDNLIKLPDNLDALDTTETDILDRLDGGNRSGISMKQGALETSNVDMSKEMTDLITVQRQYQFQARAISIADQMDGLVNGIR